MNYRIEVLKIFLIGVLLLIGNIICAQQDPLNSMYVFDKALINPAFSGSSDWAVGTIKIREQYTGLEGNPSTQTFNFHTPIQRRTMGGGMKIINDEIGFVKTLNAALVYSYHLNFGGGKLSFGLEGGIMRRQIDYSNLILAQMNDKVFPLETQSATIPDLSWGTYFQKKQFYAGISNYHLIKKPFNDSEVSDSKLFSHIYFLAGNVFKINKEWAIEASTLVKYIAAAPIQIDLNSILYYKERVGVGVQYRTNDAFVAFFKVNILDNLRIAYAYDMVTSELSSYATGSHELIISYGIKLPPPPSQKEVHPRFYF